jgi:spectinomycin phosphotransferase
VRDDPELDAERIAACLAAHYGLEVSSLAYLPIGHDLNAFVYEVGAPDGAAYFLKIRGGPVYEPGLLAPNALVEGGVPNILAPLRTLNARLWCPLDGYDGYTVVLYPYVRGESAMFPGLSDEQWRTFGATLQAVHESGLADHFRARLRTEDFALPSAALVRRISSLIRDGSFVSPVAMRLAGFWWENAKRIEAVLARAEDLGRSLQNKQFELVLCHSDIHTANILVGADGRIWLVDWDGPLIAPRERDLLFVVGSRIAREVLPREEDWFFEGYGPVEIDPDALIYYRYERIVEDLGEFGTSVFVTPGLSEQARAGEAELAMGFFAPGGDIERAERITRTRWS